MDLVAQKGVRRGDRPHGGRDPGDRARPRAGGREGGGGGRGVVGAEVRAEGERSVTQPRPGAIPGAVVSSLGVSPVSAGPESWNPAGTAARDAAGVTGTGARVAFLVRKHAVFRYREARGDVLGERAEVRELVEAAVIHPAVPLQVERQRPLQQQLLHELVVGGGRGKLDCGRATARGA